MTIRTKILAYVKYNLLTMPVIFAIYLPYNFFWIGYTPVQLVKWLLTAAFFGALANVVLQPWISFVHRKGWIERK